MPTLKKNRCGCIAKIGGIMKKILGLIISSTMSLTMFFSAVGCMNNNGNSFPINSDSSNSETDSDENSKEDSPSDSSTETEDSDASENGANSGGDEDSSSNGNEDKPSQETEGWTGFY